MTHTTIPLPATDRSQPGVAFKLHTFSRVVRRWLALIEHSYCCSCRAAKPFSGFAHDKRCRMRICIDCTKLKSKANAQAHRERVKRWQARNPDKVLKYARKSYSKHRGRRLQKYRSVSEKVKARRRAAARRNYRIRKAQCEVFDARCFVCGAAYRHDGTRTTCTDECRLKKLKGVRNGN